MNGNGSIWNKIPGLIEGLVQGIKDNWSAKRTSETLSKLAGERISKNAVIGRARRTGLPPFQSGEDGKYPRKPKQPRKYHQVSVNIVRPHIEYEQPPEAELPADFLGLTLLELSDNGCRFPAGDGPSYLFCGNPQWADSSYCQHHHRICNIGIPAFKKPGESHVVLRTQAGYMQNSAGRSNSSS